MNRKTFIKVTLAGGGAASAFDAGFPHFRQEEETG